MKKLKRKIALLLVLCLVLTGAVPSYAEGMTQPEKAADVAEVLAEPAETIVPEAVCAEAAEAVAAEAVEAELTEDEAGSEIPAGSAEKAEQAAMLGDADPVTYFDWDDKTKQLVKKQCTEYIVIDSSTAEPEGGYAFESGKWYVVKETVTFNNRIQNNASKYTPAHLILVDGKNLTAPKGIHNPDGKGLVIYGQSAGTGKLTVRVGDIAHAGIGGEFKEDGGSITINGGTVESTAGDNSAAIGGGDRGNGGNITVNGGTVIANGRSNGAAIGGGDARDGGPVTINGGTVTANGYDSGAGIGGGYGGKGGPVTINGGTVTATGYNFGAGIGGGHYGNGGTVIINGGTVTATGGGHPGTEGGTGIGGGFMGNGGDVILKGGKITVEGAPYTPAIGSGAERFVQPSVPGTLNFDRNPMLVLAEGKPISAKELKANVEASVAVRYRTVYVAFGQANYTVEHWKQKELFKEEYVRSDSDTEILVGFVDNDTEAKAKDFPGYVAKPVTQVPITEDNKAVVRIRYDLYYSTITFNTNGRGTAPQPIKNVPGARISAPKEPTAEGYIFGGWHTDKECTNPYEFSTMPEKDLTVYAKWLVDPSKFQDVSYIDSDGRVKTASCIVLSADADSYIFDEGGWYAVTGNAAIENRINTQASNEAPAHLILADDCSLNAKCGIECGPGKGLVIYGQSVGTGKVTATGDVGHTGIGDGGDVTISGGTVIATGTGGRAGIGGNGGVITINAGTVTATGGVGRGAGIGGGWENAVGTIIINGGTVTAAGTGGGAGIGYRNEGQTATIIINGGTVTATGSNGADGIGEGVVPGNINITINGGEIIATGGTGKAGIGGNLSFGNTPSELKAGAGREGAEDVSAETYLSDHSGYPYAHLKYVKADYTVAHKLQKALFSDEYELKDTDTLSGYINNDTRAEAKDYSGYKPLLPVEQKKIAETGTVVEIKYDLIYSTIFFDANGHGTAPEPIYAVPGSAITAPRDPFVEGYTFGGWYTEAECTNKFIFSTMPSEDKILYAKWTPIPYTITWKDGNTVLRTDKVDYDAMPDYGPDPSKTGYEFVLWWPTIQKVSGDATYNAIFYKPAVKHTVTWMLNDIKLIDITEVTEGEMPVHENPERDGYIFIGWKPAPAPVTGNVKYTAYFEERGTNKIAVTFHTDGGTFINTQVIDRNTTPVKPSDPQKAGCRFEGWYREPGFITPYHFDEPFNTDMTLYAKWEVLPAVVYTVTWTLDDGTLIDTTEVKEGDMPSHSSPSKEGYIFVGWEPDLSPVTKDITYTAQFVQRSPDMAAVMFNTGGGSFIETQVVTKGQKAQRPADPIKSGYSFVNWYADAAFAALYDFNTAVSADITLFAKWQKNAGREYTITWKDWNGNILATSKVIENGLPKYPGTAKPVRSGYAFTGWTPEIDLATADQTYTAIYVKTSSGGGGGGGGGSVPAVQKPVVTFSPNWYADNFGVWRIKNSAGKIVTNAWLCDDAVAANGQNVWYLLTQDGAMLAAGLVQDATGNFYSLETNHDGYFGMLRYTDGYYNCNGQQVYLQFSQKHDGTFGAITNAEGLEKLKAIYGVTQYGIGNENAVYTKTF